MAIYASSRVIRTAALLLLALVTTLGSASAAEEYPPRWHHELLRKAGEPLLTDARGHVEEYRLVYEGAFEYPLLLRATRIGNLMTLRAVHFGGDRVHKEKRVSLSKEEWQRIVLLAEKAGFWEMSAGDDESGLDGTTWLMEGRRNGVYRAVIRWSPTYDPERRGLVPFLLLGRHMAKLSKIGVNPN